MSGGEALAHVMRATGRDEAAALALLQEACAEGLVDGRARGDAARRDRAWRNDRNLDDGEYTWRQTFIYCTVAPDKMQCFLADFREKSEFRRETVQSRWQCADEAPGHDAPRPAASAPAEAATPPDTTDAKKRPHNGADFRLKDAPLVAEMRAMIEAGKAQSPEHAASFFLNRATGGGKPDSKAKRLALRYRAAYPAQS
jgi:hypothetical protein